MPWFSYLPMRGIISKGQTASMGVPTEFGRCVVAWKGMARFIEGVFSREGKVGDGFFLVINITRWNHMHIGSVP